MRRLSQEMGKRTDKAYKSRLDGIKLEVSGWIDKDGEQYTNIPKVCIKCGGTLWRANALQLCGIYMVGCKNSKCRWCEIYEE